MFGMRHGSGYSGWSKAKAKLDRRLGVGSAGWSGGDWSLHDMRRTLSTRLHETMVEPHIVEAVLAHVGHRAGVAGVYNRALYAEPKRQALELWERMIRRMSARRRKRIRKILKSVFVFSGFRSSE